ncbi:hypothetical protein cyc_05964 [Cyclospora cayetanensis]|uniref:Polycystin cation channel PKD1/PKD2 domain-containing protein n=1 Tax=Cyclospora cayetanensis TaxID=88456 RepID=A0A1D3D773_9EIME|nr:hypothetical protein cyc_05964 [Cyclospora cayetanensis]
MTQEKWVHFQGEAGDVAAHITEEHHQEQEANRAAAALINEYRQHDGPITAEQKKALIAKGYKEKLRYREKSLLLKEPKPVSLGNALKGQIHLSRREVFRRKLFPIRFEESARNVEEVQKLLMQRQPVGQLVISIAYLAMLLLFLSYAVEITNLYEAADGIVAPIKSARAPTPSDFNTVSFEVAKAEQESPRSISSAVDLELVQPLDFSLLANKGDVASWLLYGFVPLLFGPSPQSSDLGSAKVLGKCFRLTFRQIELQAVDGFDLGFEGVWPLTTAKASSSIAASKLRSSNVLTNQSGSRFKYTYPFVASGEDKAFNKKGGYYQVICEDSVQKAQASLQQAQQHSRYPPWFVPMPVIADRRTISTVVDFFAVNPVTQTFSHCSVLFAFTSSGTLQRPRIWVSSLAAFSSQSDGLVRYIALGLTLTLLLLYLICEYTEVEKLGFKVWAKGIWSIFLLFHLLVLVGFLASFTTVQVIATLAPEIGQSLGDDGYYDISDEPTAANEAEFFQLLSSYAYLFDANDGAQYALTVFGSLSALTGCILTSRLLPAVAGIGMKSLLMTFRKVKNYLLACTFGMLAILLIFVSLGNISFGEATTAFCGYYESLTTSTSFLLGGTLGNSDVYTVVSAKPILAGIFFVSLFLIFSVFGFTILIAVMLRKYDLCAQSIEQNVMKYKLDEQELFRTRYEWLRHTVPNIWRRFWKAACWCRKEENLALLSEIDEFEDDCRETKELKELEKRKKGIYKKKRGKNFYRNDKRKDSHSSAEEYYDTPPQYPPWVWQTIGIDDPTNIYASRNGAQAQDFYVDPTSMPGPTDCYFTPNIAGATVPKAPAPSVAKVYLMVRNQVQEDHQDAWKKLFIVAFVAIIVATVNMQLSVYTASDMRDMVAQTLSTTAFPLDPVKFTLADSSLGQSNLEVSLSYPDQQLLGVGTTRDLYSWLVGDHGLMAFLASPTEPSVFDKAFPKLTLSDEVAFQIVLLNHSTRNTLVDVHIKFPRNAGGTFSPNLSIEAFNLQPYSTWDSTAVTAVALQVATAALFLFFGCSFFVELKRLWSTLKEQRQDFSCGLCLGVFFVDDLFNVFDLIGFGVLACCILLIGRKLKRMTLMFFTLASAAGEVVHILMGTTLVFLGFSYACFLSFGRHVERHSTIKNSCISTFLLSMGYFPLSELFEADAGMAGAFIFPYLFFMGIICFSLFLCVLLRSLAYRSAEIKAMERLGKVEERSVLRSLQLFLQELCCIFQPPADMQANQQDFELPLQEEETAFGKRTASDQEADLILLEKIGQAERRRRERPIKVVELPPDVVTSALSDEQYANLPEEARLFAQTEVASFVDRFRLMATQLRLGNGDIVTLLQKLENEAYTELSTLAREVAQQEGHLQHELSVYTSRIVEGQKRLTAYIKFLEQALQDREDELQLQQQELKLLETKFEDQQEAAERYGRKR